MRFVAKTFALFRFSFFFFLFWRSATTRIILFYFLLLSQKFFDSVIWYRWVVEPLGMTILICFTTARQSKRMKTVLKPPAERWHRIRFPSKSMSFLFAKVHQNNIDFVENFVQNRCCFRLQKYIRFRTKTMFWFFFYVKADLVLITCLSPAKTSPRCVKIVRNFRLYVIFCGWTHFNRFNAETFTMRKLDKKEYFRCFVKFFFSCWFF